MFTKSKGSIWYIGLIAFAIVIAFLSSANTTQWIRYLGYVCGILICLFVLSSLWKSPRGLLDAALLGLPGGIFLGVLLKNLLGFSPQADCFFAFHLIDASGIAIIALAVGAHLRTEATKPGMPTPSGACWSIFFSALLFMGAYLFTSWLTVSNPRWQPFYAARIAGLLPFSDAGGWYVGSLLVQEGDSVSWVARRPLHALLRAGELLVAGNFYKVSLLFQGFMLASAIGILGMVVSRAFSFSVGVLLTILLINYSFESS